MSNHAPHDSVSSITSASILATLPALTMLLLIGVADLVLDGWVVVAVVGCAIVGVFAGDALLGRTTTGATWLSAQAGLADSFDESERKVNLVARYGAFAIGLVVSVATDTGTGAIAIGIVVGFVLSQLAFAVWLHGRPDKFSHAAGS